MPERRKIIMCTRESQQQEDTAMETFEAIRARRSVRGYESKPIPDEVLDKILETGRIAPSASNRQPWHFIVVKDKEKRFALTAGPYAKFLKESPVVIVGCGDKRTSPDWYAVDVAIALQQMVIAATAEGLGTCWIGSFYEDQVRALLKIPDKFEVVAMLAMGYPKDKLDLKAAIMKAKHRKAMAEILSREEYGSR